MFAKTFILAAVIGSLTHAMQVLQPEPISPKIPRSMRGMMKDRSCANTPYCVRNRDTDFTYVIDKNSIRVEDNALTATLYFYNDTTTMDINYAPMLHLTMSFFQEGIVHFVINESQDFRFYISDSLKMENLEAEYIEDKVYFTDDSISVQTNSTDKKDIYWTTLSYNGFNITQKVNGIVSN